MLHIHQNGGVSVNKQGDIIKLKYDDNGRERSQLYVVVSRDEYNLSIKRMIVCPIVVSNIEKPFFVPVNQEGLRGGSKASTIDVCIFNDKTLEDCEYERVGSVSNKEFIQIAQKFAMNFKFPL